MRKLTKHEKDTLSNIFDELCKCELFVGKYDARHGKESFMYGIETVMETLASMISTKKADEFCKLFTENMITSEEKKGEKIND